MKCVLTLLFTAFAASAFALPRMKISDVLAMEADEIAACGKCELEVQVAFKIPWEDDAFVATDVDDMDGHALYFASFSDPPSCMLDGIGPGDILNVTGTLDPMLLEPGVALESVKLVAHADLPPPRMRSVLEIKAGHFNNRRVRVRGVGVSAMHGKAAGKPAFLLCLLTSDGEIRVRVRNDGLWDFKDGAVGSSANEVAGRSDMTNGVQNGVGVALTRSPDTGLVPVYDADAPGERIFASSEQSAANVLVKEPQSLKFTTTGEGSSTSGDSSSVGGGLIRFPKLGSAISAQTNYTIECFFKDEDWSEWQWASGLFGFYSRSGDAVVINQAMVSSVKSGKTAWDITIQNANIEYDSSKSWKDGNWHHLALVYNGTARQLKLYVDYKPGGTVEYENGFNMDSDFILGTRADKSSNYAFRGKVSCLRVLPVALEPSGFMTYGNAPGLMIIVR